MTPTAANPPGAEPSAALSAGMPLRAGALIVTLYGDVIAPRGGEAWVGSVIGIGAALGLSETLVRTAVSRLVAAGQLEGERRGRRSFYRLSAAAQAEYAAAAEVIYAAPAPCGWRFVWSDGAVPPGHALLAPGLSAGPDRGPIPAGAVFRAKPAGDATALRDFAARHWDLAALSAAYDGMLAATEPLAAQVDLSGAEALRARLLLVHRFRHVVLRDPHLPEAALPVDWPGRAARAAFARAYLQLSRAADPHVGAVCAGPEGRLPAQTQATDARLSGLAAQLDG